MASFLNNIRDLPKHICIITLGLLQFVIIRWIPPSWYSTQNGTQKFLDVLATRYFNQVP